jgi:carboxylate-amine ligase
MNVQSCHINLPFGGEEETMLLHNAIACLLPYLPALSASSPVYEGQLGPYVDNRLAFYRNNQSGVPSITGDVVPEFMFSFRQYRREILGRIYRDLRRIDGTERLRHEWVNSRGAIMRFWRDSIEIRTLDVQECVAMDIAVACFVRGTLSLMVRWLREGRMRLPPHAMLVDDFRRAIERGSKAQVEASHLREALRFSKRDLSPIAILRELLGECPTATPAAERRYLVLVEDRLRRGNLSERIRARLVRLRGDQRRAETIRGIYRELAECLETNTPW